MGSFQELDIDLESITDPKIKQAMVFLFNLIEDLSSENSTLRQENQQLRNEIALLKGEQGKPQIRGKNQKPAGDISSEQERREPTKERRKKGSKQEHASDHPNRSDTSRYNTTSPRRPMQML